ncbi:N-acetylmuramoyl-L-alanine amidase [Myxococcota bacterium]|nr:N-acetylmuramoyl-L-alanine amidase [Myxococcota bacterium]
MRIFHLNIFAILAIFALGGGVSDSAYAATSKAASHDYEKARQSYYRLKSDKKRQRFRHHWQNTIRLFERVSKKHPKSEEAARALYTMGTLWRDLYDISYLRSDLKKSVANFGEVAKRHKKHSLADDALWQKAAILRYHMGESEKAMSALSDLLKLYPRGDMASKARKIVSALGGRKTQLAKSSAVKKSDKAKKKTSKAELKKSKTVAKTKRVSSLPAGQFTVVLDPGHGGKDGGAAKSGLREKDVVLALSKKVRRRLEAAGVEVVLTREKDVFVSLGERTNIANRSGADIFVSIHANSYKDSKIRGIETYFLNVTDDRYALRLAAVENSGAKTKLDDVDFILKDLVTKVNTDDSKKLAGNIQSAMVRAARKHDKGVKDMGVKSSLFHVLLGAHMPSVLIEAAFISNPHDARLLKSSRFQDSLAGAIAESIIQHLGVPQALVSP